MVNLLRDFQDTLLAERVAAAARKRAPKSTKAPKKVPSKPVLLDVGKRERNSLEYLREYIADSIRVLEIEKRSVDELVEALESERNLEKEDVESKGRSLPVSDADFEKELEKKKWVGLSVVYEIYNNLHKGMDNLADTLETNQDVTNETELTEAVKGFAKLLDSEKLPTEDPDAFSKAIGLLIRAKSELPDSLTSPSTLGRFRDGCKLIAEAINVLSKNNLKAPKIPNALEEEDPRQLGFGFTARHYVRLAMIQELTDK